MNAPACGGVSDTQLAPTWLGWLDSNQRMRESKSRALPLGYTPMWKCGKGRSGRSGPQPRYGVGNGARTHDTRNHNPVLCQLSYTHHMELLLTGGKRPGLLLWTVIRWATDRLPGQSFGEAE